MEGGPSTSTGGRRLPAWLERPAGTIRLGVILLAAAAAVGAAYAYPGAIRHMGDLAASNSALSYADREIAAGNELVVDQEAVYQARARIPTDETYRVEVGSDFRGGSERTATGVDDFFHYFLMPRRPAGDAPWLICYGCDLAVYGGRAKVVWENDQGVSIARIAE